MAAREKGRFGWWLSPRFEITEDTVTVRRPAFAPLLPLMFVAGVVLAWYGWPRRSHFIGHEFAQFAGGMLLAGLGIVSVFCVQWLPGRMTCNAAGIMWGGRLYTTNVLGPLRSLRLAIQTGRGSYAQRYLEIDLAAGGMLAWRVAQGGDLYMVYFDPTAKIARVSAAMLALLHPTHVAAGTVNGG